MVLPNCIDRNAMRKIKFDEAPSDFNYWQARSFEDRLATLEAIRKEYSEWTNDTEQGFQRVYSIVKQK